MTRLLVLNKRHGVGDFADYIYVGRPSPWGNPWRVGQPVSIDYISRGRTHLLTRADAVANFRAYAERRLTAQPDWLDPLLNAEALIYWCAPLACHADVLADIIEARRD